MAAKGKRKAAPNHWPMDTKESKDDQGGPTKEEEPGNVGRQPGAQSKYYDMGKQAREVVGNPKDSGMKQARKKVQERKSDGKDGQDPNFKAKAQ
ncbi:hypothetical protein PAXRUDRAFT_16526 [Paxillus rubicundulus Ve08.2h10]|uniref:Unplaced genomic scaffold scaffold_1567, whole genome shotgun sequence n=1 Tax=Paxillus rubicundulus Ve08.2h10 TaxID=930991 RepID=A0A0D0DL75_9AGAM|nr:hypothetical protein PAXRUDRAFT_16526 [Paxillus rubicundulus Ve08.2h10]